MLDRGCKLLVCIASKTSFKGMDVFRKRAKDIALCETLMCLQDTAHCETEVFSHALVY